MSANHDAALAAYLRAHKVLPADKIASAQTHQAVVMPGASLAQVLLHLKYLTQESIDSAMRVARANVERLEAKSIPPPQDAMTRAVGEARSTSEELAAVAKLISAELKKR